MKVKSSKSTKSSIRIQYKRIPCILHCCILAYTILLTQWYIHYMPPVVLIFVMVHSTNHTVYLCAQYWSTEAEVPGCFISLPQICLLVMSWLLNDFLVVFVWHTHFYTFTLLIHIVVNYINIQLIMNPIFILEPEPWAP